MPSITDIDFLSLLSLELEGPSTFLGPPARYPWGEGLFGGQVIAQALKASSLTVANDRHAHSLHAYFIRQGTCTEPTRYRVKRLRDGRSFSTRQVLAQQSSGTILSLTVSFQIDEDEADIQTCVLPDIPVPEDPSNRDWQCPVAWWGFEG